MSIKNKINQIKKEFDSDFNLLKSESLNFESVYNKYLSRKGLISKLYPLLLDIDKSNKPKFGQEINL